ncbi:hypothetical protein V8F20_002376 [Naviculisporaceae sp. PSN 640]
MADLIPSDKAEFIIERTLPNNLFLLRKTTSPDTGDRFLGCLLPQERTKLTQLEERGAGKSLLNLLNHENLVNLHTISVSQPVNGTGRSPPEGIIVWDYCDAGSLADLFADPPDLQDENDGFLPEGLIWHVALGMLRALQWLHEGVRDGYTVKGPTLPVGSSKKASYRTRVEKVRGTAPPEMDWWPILHRDIRPENVLFQHSRGVETYGLVKLGNFAKAHVSGIVNVGRSTVVAMDSPENDVDIETLRERLRKWKDDPDSVPVNERPYTPGSELFALGAILFRMMTGKILPSPEKCTECDGCKHISFQDEPPPPPSESCLHKCAIQTINIPSTLNSLDAYTLGLKQLVSNLLYANRSMYKFLTSRMLNTHWPSYIWWCENMDEGKRHRDLFDDLWAREKMRSRRMRKRVLIAEEEEEQEEGDDDDDDDDMASLTTTHHHHQQAVHPTPPPPPTLFLFDKITAFLNTHQETSPTPIRILALSNPKGELLAHSTGKIIPIAVIRRQCAVAASLFPPVFEPPATATATPSTRGSGGSRPGSSMSTSTMGGGNNAQTVTVTIDDGSVVVIRRLSCGILFIATGEGLGGGKSPAVAPATDSAPAVQEQPSATTPGAEESNSTPQVQGQGQMDGEASAAAPTEEESSSAEGAAMATATGQTEEEASGTVTGPGSGTGTTTANATAPSSSAPAPPTTSVSRPNKKEVLLLRRHIEQIARLLDTQLSAMYVPEEAIGVFSSPFSPHYGRDPPWAYQ